MLLGVASVDVDQAGDKKIALEILAGEASPVSTEVINPWPTMTEPETISSSSPGEYFGC